MPQSPFSRFQTKSLSVGSGFSVIYFFVLKTDEAKEALGTWYPDFRMFVFVTICIAFALSGFKFVDFVTKFKKLAEKPEDVTD